MANIHHATAAKAVNRYPSLIKFATQKLLRVVARVQNLFFHILKRYYPHFVAAASKKRPLQAKIVEVSQKEAPLIIVRPTAPVQASSVIHPTAPIQGVLDLTKVSNEGHVDRDDIKYPTPPIFTSPNSEIRHPSQLATFDEYKEEAPAAPASPIRPSLDELHAKLEEIEKGNRKGVAELEVPDFGNLYKEREGVQGTDSLPDKKAAISVIVRGLTKIQGEKEDTVKGEKLDAILQDGVKNYQEDQFSIDHLDSLFKAYPGLKYAHLSLGSLVEKGGSLPRSTEGEAKKVLLKWLKDTFNALSADAPKEGYRVIALKKTKENPQSYGLLIQPKSSEPFVSLLQLGEKEVLSYRKFEGIEGVAERLANDAGALSNLSPQEEFQLIRLFNRGERPSQLDENLLESPGYDSSRPPFSMLWGPDGP